jgi:GNAT superfamily N-acetyltransferase
VPRPTRLALPADRPALEDLFDGVFGWRRSTEAWAWQYPLDGSRWNSFVVEADGAVVGHLGWALFPTWVDGEPGTMMIAADTMVAPSHRGQGVMGALVEASLVEARGRGVDVRVAFPRDVVGSMAERYGAGKVIGHLPQWIRWRDGRSLAASTGRPRLAPVAGLGMGAFRAAVGAGRERGAAVEEIGIDSSEFATAADALAEESRNLVAIGRVRDAGYQRWRWARPGSSWRAFVVRGDDGVAGVAVAERSTTSDGIARARIVDLFAVDEAATVRLLDGVATTFESDGAGLVTFEYADPRRWSRRACYRAGFLPRGDGPCTIVLAVSARAQALPPGWASWFVTYADTDLV